MDVVSQRVASKVFRDILQNTSGHWLPPIASSAGIPPGCAERGWNRNRGSSRHHPGSHAHEFAWDHDPQQALPGLHLWAFHEEHPLHGQDQQPHSHVKTQVEQSLHMCVFTLQDTLVPSDSFLPWHLATVQRYHSDLKRSDLPSRLLKPL